VIFALDGLPQIKGLEGHTGATVYEQIAQMKNEFVQRQELVRTGSLVPGSLCFK